MIRQIHNTILDFRHRSGTAVEDKRKFSFTLIAHPSDQRVNLFVKPEFQGPDYSGRIHILRWPLDK